MSQFKKKFIKVDNVVEQIQTWMCVFLFSSILILGAIQIFGRYIFNASTPWTEELMRFAGVWLAFIGSSLTVRADGHVSVDVLLNFTKGNEKKARIFLVSRLIAFLTIILYLPSSIILILKTRTSVASSIPLPYAYVYLAVPVGIILMAFSYVRTIPEYTKKYLEGDDEQ